MKSSTHYQIPFKAILKLRKFASPLTNANKREFVPGQKSKLALISPWAINIRTQSQPSIKNRQSHFFQKRDLMSDMFKLGGWHQVFHHFYLCHHGSRFASHRKEWWADGYAKQNVTTPTVSQFGSWLSPIISNEWNKKNEPYFNYIPIRHPGLYMIDRIDGSVLDDT